VRVAGAEDAERIAALCCQLGYPSSPEQIQRRLYHLRRDEGHAVYAAERADGRLVGWIHVHVSPLMMADLQAEVEGLVVDESCRGQGIGRLLMGRAERWAREKGCGAVQLRSNVVRTGAHAFYERIGYSTVKTQLTFHKAL